MPATTPQTLTRAVLRCHDAALADPAGAFPAALADLALLDVEQVRTVLGFALRRSLEERHPDGLDADDLRDVVARTARAAAGWPALDPGLLVVALAGSLGEHPDAEDHPWPAAPALVLGHGALLLADASGGDGARARALLATGLAEVRRAETVEVP